MSVFSRPLSRLGRGRFSGRDKLNGKLYCRPSITKEEADVSFWDVSEDVAGGHITKKWSVSSSNPSVMSSAIAFCLNSRGFYVVIVYMFFPLEAC